MMIDVAAGLVLLVMAIIGWRSGLVLQLWRGVILIAAALLAKAVGPEMALFYIGKVDSTPLAATTVCYFIAFTVFWAGFSYALHRLAGDMGAFDDDRPIVDRLGGVALAAGRGALLVLLLIMGLASVHENTGRVALPYQQSRVAQVSARHSFLGGMAIELEARELARVPLHQREYPSATGFESDRR